ncbi:hypothetical protein ACFWDI_35770 [Streptomyces sp. NPDC060064]|uniref:hypothetical protein n=1 Tax=Streptomyces sp. NPDC060064 TaxID=3347049 RepID=UPI0036BE51C3
MNVDDIVAAKIEAARARVEANKRRRLALAAARKRGLALRHAQKLRNLAARRTEEAHTEVPEEPQSGDVDDVVLEVTEAELHAAVRTSLARLGLTYAQLEAQARRRDFTSAQAQILWTSVGGAVNPELLEPQDNPVTTDDGSDTTEEN